ncbi:MAG: DUF4248 domain-containing protein [Bacteroidales bacterium]|nr:DUF4248 domain-containing protein [Bacteroidales bacterium]
MKNTFVTKSELAMMYFPGSSPDTARHHLMAWIRKNPRLAEELEKSGYSKKARYFSPKEIKLIARYLGDP